MDSKRNVAYFCILTGLSVLLWLPRFRGPIDLRWDAGVYYILGTSLAEGKGYRILSEPGDIQAIQYPPLLSSIVASQQWMLRTHDPILVGHALRITFFLFFVIFIAATYRLAQRYLSLGYAFLVGLICVVSLHPVFMSDLLFAEIPYGLATLLFLLALYVHAKSPRRIYWVLESLFAVVTYLLRTIGLALLIAWVADSVFRRDFRRTAVRAGVALIPIIAWPAYIAMVKSGPEYNRPAYAYQRAGYQFYNVDYGAQLAYIDVFAPELGKASLRDFAKRIVQNCVIMPITLGESITVAKTVWEPQRERINEKLPLIQLHYQVINLILGLLGGLMAGGIILLALRREWPIPIYVVVYLLLVCITPWPGQFQRYLMPILPFLALCLVQFLVAIKDFCSRRFVGRWRAAGPLLAALVISVILIQKSFVMIYVFKRAHTEVTYYDREGQARSYRLFFYDGYWRAFDTAIEWLKTHAQAHEIVATTAPHWVYLKTGLKSIMPPYEQNSEKSQRLLEGVPVSYVIIDNLEFLDVSRRYAAVTIQAYPTLWRLVYSSPGRDVFIYQRVVTQ